MTGNLTIDVRSGTNTGLEGKLFLTGARTDNAQPNGSIHFGNNNSTQTGILGFHSKNTNAADDAYFKFSHKVYVILFSVALFTFSCKTEHKTEESTAEVASELIKPERIKHTVMSDGHPMALWEKKTDDSKGIVLFIHGRTWSGVPDFDLQVEGEDLSLMDGLIEKGYSLFQSLGEENQELLIDFIVDYH